MKGIEFNLVWMAAVICLGVASAQAAYGQEQTQGQDGWDFRVGIPLWASGATGTVGVRNREVHIDDSFTDLLDTLDFTAALNLEIRKSRWLFFSDGFYVKTSTSGDPRGLFSGARVHLNQKLAFDDLAIGYAVVKNERFSLEPFAGAQLVYLEPQLTLDLPVADRTASTTKFWAEPIVGVYLNYRFSKPVGFYAKADVGGFDVSSRLTWQAEGGLDFPLGGNFYARLAYRYLNTDYEKGAVFFDAALHGPQLELGVRF
jgi:opacity protein-like surface antigen